MNVPTNRVMLNVPLYSSAEPPEPGVAAVMIDGKPIHGVQHVSIVATVGEYTRVSLVFQAEVGGLVGGQDVGDILRNASE